MSRITVIAVLLATAGGTASAQAPSGTPVGAVQTWEARRTGVRCQVALGDEQATALVSALSSRVIRIQVSPDPQNIAAEEKGEAVAVSERDDALVLTVSRLVLTITKSQFGITIGTQDGGVVFDCSVARGGGFRFGAQSLGTRAPAAVLGFATAENEHFYGLGGKFNSLDQRGKRAGMWIEASFASIGDESSVCVPFFVSSRGYGLWLNSNARAAFDFRASAKGQAQAVVAAPKLDVYFIMGPALGDVIREYVELTGRSPLPAPWAFLPWVSAGSYDTQEDVLSVARRMRAENIPCSVIVIENWRGSRFYEFDSGRFPDPEAMLRELRQMDFHCLLGMLPFVHPSDALVRDAPGSQYLVRDEDGEVAVLRGRFGMGQRYRGWALVDFSNAEAAAWWAELHRPLLKMGVEGFKTLVGDVVSTDMRFANALTGAEMHNLYPNLYNGCVYDLVRKETDGRGLIWASSGSAGIQQYPAMSAGARQATWVNLRAVMRVGLSAGMSGIPFWGHDIGGYDPTPPKELYLRWAQFGAFSPIMQLHGRNAQEPWRFDDETLRIYRRYATVRANLLPYIHSIAKQAADTGMPLMRPLALAYPEDEQAAAVDDEYLLGPNLLVAPVCEPGVPSREVYLPAGQWVDFWENTLHVGPKRVSRAVSLDTIPAFVRADGIIPMELARGRSPGDELRATTDLTLDLYPFTRGRFSLLDHGTVTDVLAEREGATVRVSVGNRKRTCVLRIMCGEPKDVEVSGTQIPPITSRRIASYDSRTQRLIIRPAGHQRIDVTMTGVRLPVLFANIEHPLSVCSAESEMAVEADLLNLDDQAKPVMTWTHSGGASGTVAGTRVADAESRWRFVAPLPGPMAATGYMRVSLVAGSDPVLSPATQTRQTTLTPPVNVRLAVGGSRNVGNAPVPVEVGIANNSRRTAAGTVTLSAAGSSGIKPAATQKYSAPAPGPGARIRFDVLFPPTLPVGEHRLTAQAKWENLDMRPETATVTKQPTWAVIGPFDNRGGRGFDRPYAPEKALNIGAPVRGKDDRFVTWRTYPAQEIAREGMMDFNRAHPGESWAVAYAAAVVESPRERRAYLRIGSDFPVAVWVNEEQVLRREQYRVAQPDQDSASARLRRGPNRILVKACSGATRSKWRLYFRITGAEEGEIADLRDLGGVAFKGIPEAKLVR